MELHDEPGICVWFDMMRPIGLDRLGLPGLDNRGDTFFFGNKRHCSSEDTQHSPNPSCHLVS